MRKTFMMRLILPAIALLIMAGCSGVTPKDNVISVSIDPLKYFVDRLTNNQLEVNVMVPQGASHGTYSPTASQMKQLAYSKLYLRIGHLGYEKAFVDKLNDLNPEMKAVDLTGFIPLIRGKAIQHGDHVHEGGVDPHIWMSPEVMLDILPVIRENLTELYPDLAHLVDSLYPSVYEDVNRIHEEMQRVIEALPEKRFMIFHPALTYLARDYQMEQFPIELDGKEPSPARLVTLINESYDGSIKVIFIQKEYDQTNATLIADETNARVVTINPMEYDWVKGMEGLMLAFNTYLK